MTNSNNIVEFVEKNYEDIVIQILEDCPKLTEENITQQMLDEYAEDMI